MNPLTIDLLIDRRETPGASYAVVVDPGRTGDHVGVVAQASAEQVNQAVQAAHAAQPHWAATPASTRIDLLRAAAGILDAEAATVAELMALESGMLIATCNAEILSAAQIVRDNADLAMEFLKPREIAGADGWVSVEKRPYGVVAGIVSWNAPVILTMRKLAPALACGNTIVLKPAPTSAIGLSVLLAKIAALLPPGVINVVHGGAEVGTALTTHPLVRKVSFTGGGKVASSIMCNAAASMKDVQFELGGNDPAIVLDDADIDYAAIRIANGAFRRAGQFCFAVKRVYVPECIYDRFFDRLSAEVDKLRIGHPLDPRSTMGPMNNRAQWNFVKELVARARDQGADIVELGEFLDPEVAQEGYYLRPALVRRAQPLSEIVAVEQFGPVLPVVAYQDEAQAVRMANESELGLGSSIWSSSSARALAIARELEAGMTFINQTGASRLGQRHAPFGGVKQSGIGRESSDIGMAEYVEYHSIHCEGAPI